MITISFSLSKLRSKILTGFFEPSWRSNNSNKIVLSLYSTWYVYLILLIWKTTLIDEGWLKVAEDNLKKVSLNLNSLAVLLVLFMQMILTNMAIAWRKLDLPVALLPKRNCAFNIFFLFISSNHFMKLYSFFGFSIEAVKSNVSSSLKERKFRSVICSIIFGLLFEILCKINNKITKHCCFCVKIYLNLYIFINIQSIVYKY